MGFLLAWLLLVLACLVCCVAHWRLFCTCVPFLRWKRKAEAEDAASALLRDLLSDGELQQLADSGYLAIPSPGAANREYRIPARSGYVFGYESGQAIMAICLQPVERLPQSDVVLMHKLMIEGDEEAYLRQANIQWLRAGSAEGTAPMLPAATWMGVLQL